MAIAMTMQPALSMSKQACFKGTQLRPRHLRTVTAASTPVKCSATRREDDHAAEPGLRIKLAAAAASAAVLLSSSAAFAVSGGGGLGNDFDFQDQSGKDFSGGQFYKVMMRGTNWSNANLENANLFGSFAKNGNFSGANLRNADLESVDFEGADLSNAVLEGAQVAAAQFRSLKSIEGSDWTDVDLRKDQRKYLCTIAAGTNPVTGVETRESLFCP